MFNVPVRNRLPDYFYADELLSSLMCDPFKVDSSPSIISEILLSERVEQPRPERGVYIRLTSLYVQNAAVNNYTPYDFCTIPSINPSLNQLRIISLERGAAADTEFAMGLVEEGYPKYTDKGAERMENIEKYLYSQKKLRSVVFMNRATGQAAVFIRHLDFAKLHLILSVFPLLLPKFFESKPLTEWEQKLLLSLASKDETRFLEMVEEWFARSDFKERMLKKQLKGFVGRRVEQKMQSLENEIRNIDTRMAELESRLGGYIRDREQKTLMLLGLATTKEEHDDEEIIDFFRLNKELNLISAAHSEMVVEVKTPLVNYDYDAFMAYLRNKNSILFNEEYYRGRDMAVGLKLIEAIFETNELQVLVKGMFSLNFEYGCFDIRRDYTSFSQEAILNPHLTEYKCPGNNARPLNEAIRNFDYIMALSYCISIAANLNFSEPHNVANFMKHLFVDGYLRKCIVNSETGEVMTVKRAMEYLEKGE